MQDAVASRPAAYKQRVRNVLKSKKAQQVAANCATSLKKTCKEVVQKKELLPEGEVR